MSGFIQLLPEERPPPRNGLLPNFCRLPMVLGVVVTAQLLAIAFTLASNGPLSRFWEHLGTLSFYMQVITLTTSGLLCLLRQPLARLNDRQAAILAWLLIVGMTGLASLAAGALVPPALQRDILPHEGTIGLLVRSLGIGAIVGVLLIRYLYLNAAWHRQVQAEAQARFQKLQARIRPHFLFNSMNTIAHLTRANPPLAEEMVQDLADLFRASLAEEDRVSTLADELQLARRFLNIEKQRLCERLSVSWDIDHLPGAAELPPLILQPLVENAIYHGIEPSRRPGQIRIGGGYRSGRVNLTISNTLPEVPGENRHRRGNRMALKNIRQRMASFFSGSSEVLEIRSDQEYQISLIFPYPRSERP